MRANPVGGPGEYTAAGRGARPHVPVEIVGRGGVGWVAGSAHVIIAVELHQPDVAEPSLLDDSVAGLNQVRRAAALRANLNYPLVLSRGGEHRLTLGHVHADRLLQVNIGPGFDRSNQRQGVPVIGRCDEHDVQVFLAEHLAVVAEGPRLLLRRLPLGHHLRCFGEHSFVDVAKGDDFDRSDLEETKQIRLPIPARSDHPNALRLVVECGSATGGGR